MSKKHTYQITGQQNCGNCLYYRRHYICREGAFYSLSYGHCIFPRLKSGCPMLPAPIGRLLTEGTTCRGHVCSAGCTRGLTNPAGRATFKGEKALTRTKAESYAVQRGPVSC